MRRKQNTCTGPPIESSVRGLVAPVRSPMCEDAARRIQAPLAQDEHIADFWIRATHQESLHPHDAVAVATKGVAGGYAAAIDESAPAHK